jgi:hypothetical protein
VGGSTASSTGNKGTGGTGASSAATGGTRAATITGGSTGFDPTTYCNGLFKDQSCSQTQVQADVRNVNMLLILDESGSMSDRPAGGSTKWEIMRQALRATLKSVETEINFGLLLFPYAPGGIPLNSTLPSETCAVPDGAAAINIPINPDPTAGPAQLLDILGMVDTQTPSGGTPTARALQLAYDYFTTGDGRTLPGTRWVILATDGGPNCNSALTCDAAHCTQNIDKKCSPGVNCCDGSANGFICLDDIAATSEISSLAAVGVKTFVVGIPGSEAYSSALNNFAVAGQMANPDPAAAEKYYAVSGTATLQDLTDVFFFITTQLVKTCDIELTTPPPNPDKVNVAIDCAAQNQVATGTAQDAGLDGYYIQYPATLQDKAVLHLVGAPCTHVQTQGVYHVDVIAGCQRIN